MNSSLPLRHFAVLLLVALPILWWWPLLTGSLPDFMDTVSDLYPQRVEAARQIREGVLPLWSPSQFCGTPLAANPQIAVFYPPRLPFWILPHPITYGALLVLHSILAGFGMFLLVRRWTPSRDAALFAGIGFQFGAVMISRMALTPHFETAAWVPWVLWAADRVASLNTIWPGRDTAVLGLFGALMFLSGSPQLCYYAALVLPLWLAVRSGTSMRRVCIALAHGGMAAALAVMLVGIQLIPTLEFLDHTSRGTVPAERLREQAVNGSMVWRALIGGTGETVEDTDSINAIGLGLLAFIPVALLRARRRRHALAALAVLAATLTLALGMLTPAWSSTLPLYESFHAPRRALLLWSCIGPSAAGIGAGVLAAWWRKNRRPAWILRLILAASLIPNALMLPRLEREFCLPDRFAPDPEVAASIGQDRFISIDPTLRYSYDSRRPDYGRSLMPDLAAWHGLRDAQGYDPLILARFALARDLACATSGTLYPSHGAFFSDPSSPVLKLMNVRWLIGRWDLFDPGRVMPGADFDRKASAAMLEEVIVHDRWPLSRYVDSRPDVWIPRRVITIPEPVRGLEAVASQRDTFEMATIEEPIPLPILDTTPNVESTRIDARTFELAFPTPTRIPSLVCLPESWMPGWRAQTSAGETAIVVPANGWQIGVVVPNGTTRVTLRYAPLSFTRGALLTLAGIIAALALLRLDRRPPLDSPN